jgi:hypothetical protein
VNGEMNVSACRRVGVPAMSLVMRIFELTKHFPIQERYTLTDQIDHADRWVIRPRGGDSRA